MDIVILAGGFATRLRPLTLTIPKPLLPILGRPLLDWIYEDLVKENTSRIVLSLHNMADRIIDHTTRNWTEIPVRHVLEERPLGDGGSLLHTLNSVGEEISYPVIVMYGDIFTKISYREIYDYHIKRGGLATIVGVYVNDVSRYGLLEVSENSALIKIIEKPKDLSGVKGLVNAGIYVFSEEIKELIREFTTKDKKDKISIARDLIPRLLKKGDVYVYRYEGVWSDIGTPSDYFRANIEALRNILKTDIYISENAEIGSNTKIDGPVYIGDNVVIGSNVRIGENVFIMGNVRIGDGVYIDNSLVMRDTVVGDYSVIKQAIVGESNIIGKWVRIYNGSILGSSIYLYDLICIPPGTLILPHKEISEDYCEKRIRRDKAQEGSEIIL